jgi:hypothetical protein
LHLEFPFFVDIQEGASVEFVEFSGTVLEMSAAATVSGIMDMYRDLTVFGTLLVSPGGLLRFHGGARLILHAKIVVDGVLELVSDIDLGGIEGSGSVTVGGAAVWSGGLGTNVTIDIVTSLRINDTSLGPGSTLVVHEGASLEMSGFLGASVVLFGSLS